MYRNAEKRAFPHLAQFFSHNFAARRRAHLKLRPGLVSSSEVPPLAKRGRKKIQRRLGEAKIDLAIEVCSRSTRNPNFLDPCFPLDLIYLRR